jgi:hypothetical protein
VTRRQDLTCLRVYINISMDVSNGLYDFSEYWKSIDKLIDSTASEQVLLKDGLRIGA